MTFNRITQKLHRYSPFMWLVLFVSVIVGFGKEDVSFISQGSFIPTGIFEVATLIMVYSMWISALIHMVEITTSSIYMNRISKISSWVTLFALITLAARTSWMFLSAGVEMSIAPATLFGALMIAIGTAGNSIGRMYDRRYLNVKP